MANGTTELERPIPLYMQVVRQLRAPRLAASRSRRATSAATRGEIITVSSICVPSGLPAGRHTAIPASRLYTIHAVMQIISELV